MTDTDQRICPICYESTESKLGMLAPPEMHFQEHRCLTDQREQDYIEAIARKEDRGLPESIAPQAAGASKKDS